MDSWPARPRPLANPHEARRGYYDTKGLYMTLDVSKVYSGQFLSAADLDGKPRRVVIEGAAVEVLGQGVDARQKVVLRLRDMKQRFVLNKTNADTLRDAYGGDAEAWTGKPIILNPVHVMFAGKRVLGIRADVPPAEPVRAVRTPTPTPAPTAQAASAGGGPFDDMADDIPF